MNAENEVTLCAHDFLSSRTLISALTPFAENLGDHGAAAVSNLLNLGQANTAFLERAVFADELSAQSAEELHQLARSQWQSVHDGLITHANALEALDKNAEGPAPQGRVRIGMYFYSDTPNIAPAPNQKAKP